MFGCRPCQSTRAQQPDGTLPPELKRNNAANEHVAQLIEMVIEWSFGVAVVPVVVTDAS